MSNRLLVAYSAILTAAVSVGLIDRAVADTDRQTIGELTVERINVREPDGTLRLVISNQARFPQAIVRGTSYPHPSRSTAGMLFYNQEGTENGGLVWGGRMVGGKRTSDGSLTFDRYEQDQTVQILGAEDGDHRRSGLYVSDRPERAMNFAALPAIAAMPEARRLPAYAAANIGGVQRAFVGRQSDGASAVVLRDAAGRQRLVLSVEKDGSASIRFLDEGGKIVRMVTPVGVTR